MVETKFSGTNMVISVLIVDLDFIFFSWGVLVETKIISTNI